MIICATYIILKSTHSTGTKLRAQSATTVGPVLDTINPPDAPHTDLPKTWFLYVCLVCLMRVTRRNPRQLRLSTILQYSIYAYAPVESLIITVSADDDDDDDDTRVNELTITPRKASLPGKALWKDPWTIILLSAIAGGGTDRNDNSLEAHSIISTIFTLASSNRSGRLCRCADVFSARSRNVYEDYYSICQSSSVDDDVTLQVTVIDRQLSPAQEPSDQENGIPDMMCGLLPYGGFGKRVTCYARVTGHDTIREHYRRNFIVQLAFQTRLMPAHTAIVVNGPRDISPKRNRRAPQLKLCPHFEASVSNTAHVASNVTATQPSPLNLLALAPSWLSSRSIISLKDRDTASCIYAMHAEGKVTSQLSKYQATVLLGSGSLFIGILRLSRDYYGLLWARFAVDTAVNLRHASVFVTYFVINMIGAGPKSRDQPLVRQPSLTFLKSSSPHGSIDDGQG
ncbi:hypothetical protein CIB48_g3825 [Xylaria polymorpha]|nr:hypothetical protein CIB48_g3825 [Xylaria polymorpha]